MEVEFAVEEKDGSDRTAAIEIKELPVNGSSARL